ncbi:dTDP-4-dehydrorhamnose 3,5-epimerase [Dyella japonica]|uniref:dTDP-4-dehydrorhamnose 3,5-epimerase n=1 Tax=Dyella japonica TaxID=231455 RepID=A0ABV2JVF3_9GAMM
MKVMQTRLPGVLVIEPRVFEDERGFFYEGFNAARFGQAGIRASFVQTNVSRSTRGVLRGLHYQWPHPQGKLVSVLEGEVYDVAVDIRQGSPTFGLWEAVTLSAQNRRHLWIPEGFAHGFCVVSEAAIFTYQCTALYEPAADATIRWNDEAIGIDWPSTAPMLSPKDMHSPLLSDIPVDKLPAYVP